MTLSELVNVLNVDAKIKSRHIANNRDLERLNRMVHGRVLGVAPDRPGSKEPTRNRKNQLQFFDEEDSESDFCPESRSGLRDK